MPRVMMRIDYRAAGKLDAKASNDTAIFNRLAETRHRPAVSRDGADRLSC
jgi:hypothetical protein